MKKILILGAGIYQVPLIKKAREMGIYTIVTSIPGNYPGFKLADKVYYENTTDKEAVLEIAKKENIDGILTTGTDVAVSSIGYVCDTMKLSGISEKSSLICTDKSKMKRALLDGGVRTGNFSKVFSLEEAVTACESLKLPVVFKCTDKSGSRGITVVKSNDEISAAFEYSMSATDKDYIIIEKFLTGYEIGIDGHVNKNGKIDLLMPHKKYVISNGFTDVPLGHSLPMEFEENSDFIKNDINNQCQKTVDALGLSNCFFNMDAMIDSDGLSVIEASGRIGATGIPEIISEYCGFDLYEKMLLCALGHEVDFSYKANGAVISRLVFSHTGGILKEIVNNSKYNNFTFSSDYELGEELPKFVNGTSRIGQIVCKCKTLKEAEENIKNIINEIDFKVE